MGKSKNVVEELSRLVRYATELSSQNGASPAVSAALKNANAAAGSGDMEKIGAAYNRLLLSCRDLRK